MRALTLFLLYGFFGYSLASYAQLPAVDAQTQSIAVALSSEPPTLNSLESTNSVSAFVLGHIMEGLLQYDSQNQLMAGVAKRWELRDNGASFWLRENARWSDGRPVTAHDFVFAWRQVVAPETASQYAFIMFPIKNAERIHQAQLPIEQLGVRAVGDYQLEVDLERPCPYFLNLTAFMTYLPVREDVFKRAPQRYAADASDMLYNGAFNLSQWVHSANLRFEKNPHYWNRESIHLNKIDIPYVTPDRRALFNLFQDGSIAMASLDVETIDEAMKRGYPLKKIHTGAQYYLGFNFREGRISAHRPFRKAIQAIFDPRTLVNKILAVPGNIPATSLFPETVKGVSGWFRDEYPPPPVERGLGLARGYISELKTLLETESLAPIVLLVGDSPRAAKEAEYLQYLLQEGLGLQVKIDAQMFKQYIEKMSQGNYDIVVAGWGPDFDDAITFGDLFASWNENNRGRYKNKSYDAWVRVAQNTLDQKKRMDAMAQLQRIISDDAVIIPTFEAGSIYVQHEQLKGVVRRRFGADPDYKFARVVKD